MADDQDQDLGGSYNLSCAAYTFFFFFQIVLSLFDLLAKQYCAMLCNWANKFCLESIYHVGTYHMIVELVD